MGKHLKGLSLVLLPPFCGSWNTYCTFLFGTGWIAAEVFLCFSANFSAVFVRNLCSSTWPCLAINRSSHFSLLHQGLNQPDWNSQTFCFFIIIFQFAAALMILFFPCGSKKFHPWIKHAQSFTNRVLSGQIFKKDSTSYQSYLVIQKHACFGHFDRGDGLCGVISVLAKQPHKKYMSQYCQKVIHLFVLSLSRTAEQTEKINGIFREYVTR